MNIFALSTELKFANRIGQTLSPQERISLEANVLKLSQEYPNEVYNFWGRIEGVTKNYYIVQGLTLKGATNFPSKKYFWRYPIHNPAPMTSTSQNCLLPDTNTLEKSTESTITSQDSTKKFSSRLSRGEM